MTLLRLEDITKSFGAEPILAGVSMRVESGDRIGVIGDNGAGKTTLIKILAGRDEADHGTRHVSRDVRVAYGAQIPELSAGTTVLDFVLRGDGSHDALEAEVRAMEAALADRPEDTRLLEDYGHLQGAFEAGGGYQRRPLCEKVLGGIGFTTADLGKDVGVLSGGEKSRAVLCALMTTPADVLILDEPTNHLDLEGIAFLESHLRRYPGATVVVSHDRHFLDQVATSIIDVDAGEAHRFKGNYSAYRTQRDERLLAQARAFKSQQALIEKEMEYIRRNMGSRMTAQAKGRLKRLERIERLTKPREYENRFRLELRGGRGLPGQAVLEVEDLGAGLPDGRVLFRNARFRLVYGETLGILGRNGAGKTTLLRILAGHRSPEHGIVERAPGVRAGYFSQEMHELPTDGTVLDAMRRVEADTVTEKELRDHLALFWFRGDEVDLPVAGLSGGEKRRLSLALLVRGDHDFLCFDEPTNHLDITMREGLEHALRGYPGGALVVSHDRAFLEAVTDRVLWVEDGAVEVYDGGLEQCLRRRAARATSASRPRGGEAASKAEPPTPTKPSPGKIRNPMLFEKLEQEIFALEEQLEAVKTRMTEPESYRDPDAMRALQHEQTACEAKLADAYQRWENWD